MSKYTGKIIFPYHYYPYYPCFPYLNMRYPYRYVESSIKLYKYCKREHMESLLERGSLLVNTLHNYKEMEELGNEIHDPLEGVKRMDGKGEGGTTPPGLQRLIKFGNVGSYTISNVVEISPNLLIFSTSSEYSEEAHQRWFEDKEAQYDACYEIFSPDEFFASITLALGADYEYIGYSKVRYADSIDIHEPDIHSALVKPERLAHQVEVRAGWKSKHNNSLERIIIDRSNAGNFCREFRVIN